MRSWVAGFSVVCLVLAVAPVQAQTLSTKSRKGYLPQTVQDFGFPRGDAIS